MFDTSHLKLTKKRLLRVKENAAILQRNLLITIIINLVFFLRFLVFGQQRLLSFKWMAMTCILYAFYAVAFFLIHRLARPSEADVIALKDRKGTMVETLFDVVHMGWIVQVICVLIGGWGWIFFVFVPAGLVWKSWALIQKGWMFTRQFQAMKQQ
mmetsp:Transcript_9691/g.35974  ORF Transcript_9691/g.35974 Transcript_9691/m.35974 type:complete len:155 (-) Transcript_9691:152-616(-)